MHPNVKNPYFSGHPVAIVYQDSSTNSPEFIVIQKNGIREGAESVQDLIRIVRHMINKIKFLNKKEINEAFGIEAKFIRPFSEEEKSKFL